ncbi:MAG: ArnT family glycosyltransferase [Candidatus Methylumidiphilus sp.]
MSGHSDKFISSDQQQVNRSQWLPLAGVLTFALITRLLFFSGMFGSDDIVYLERSIDVATGTWSSANYNGALRYGFNIPAGLLLHFFGVSEPTANLWPLFCSLAEIAVVYLLAVRLWGHRTAAYVALIMASFPLHIAVATRIHADPVVCLFITLSFCLFYLGEKSNRRRTYFLCGVAMGLVFWAKELAFITVLPFLAYPLIFWRINLRWVYVIAGGALLFALHLALMQWIADDPLHLYKVVTGQISNALASSQAADELPVYYYLKYLFFDVRHTWISCFFAIPILFVAATRRSLSTNIGQSELYIIFWLVSLLIFLSLSPVSINPFRFVQKQSNYLTIFLAPIALLAGRQIANIPKETSLVVMAIVVIGGVALGALQQVDYRTFTSNSKAAVAFARAHTNDWVIGSANNENIAIIYSRIVGDTDLPARFYDYGVLAAQNRPGEGITQSADEGYLILDRQTMGWGAKAMPKLAYPLACWQSVATLKPTGFGLGNTLLNGASAAFAVLPEALAVRLSEIANKLGQPQPATVYRVSKSNLLCQN